MTIYVTMTDRFMSGWGHANGLINKLVFICSDWTEAHTVYANAKRRGDMRHVNISSNKPRYYRVNSGSDYQVNQYYVQNKTRDDYPFWYQAGYFGGDA